MGLLRYCSEVIKEVFANPPKKPYIDEIHREFKVGIEKTTDDARQTWVQTFPITKIQQNVPFLLESPLAREDIYSFLAWLKHNSLSVKDLDEFRLDEAKETYAEWELEPDERAFASTQVKVTYVDGNAKFIAGYALDDLKEKFPNIGSIVGKFGTVNHKMLAEVSSDELQALIDEVEQQRSSVNAALQPVSK